MLVIKNSKELSTFVDKKKDLIIDEDVRIEFEPTKEEIRDIKCKNLYLENDDERFSFNGRNFNGWNFNGGDFNGRDFHGRDFHGRDFNGKKLSYYAFFICYGSCQCTSWEKRREKALDPVCLDGKFEVVDEEVEDKTEEAIKLLKDKGYKIVKD